MTDPASHVAADTLARRRRDVQQILGDRYQTVLFAAGSPIGKPGGRDACYPFIPHPEYYWLTGYRRPGGVLAYTIEEGFRHFTRYPTPRERLFDGDERIPAGDDVEKLGEWLATRADHPIVVLGNGLPDVDSDEELDKQARELVHIVRRRKDADEIATMQRACAATAAGYEHLCGLIRPGVSERALQIELEAAFFRSGGDCVGYDTILLAGQRAAVLHGVPSAAVLADGDVLLVDAGAQVDGYTADVTRTYAVGGKFDARQQAFYDAVHAALVACSDACRPGIEWYDVHRLAARTLAQGLRDMGILKLSVDAALETEAIALFFPHGIGHMVGLGVRDVGGNIDGRDPEAKCCGVNPRVDLPLEPGHLMTVEPGLYFVAGILDDAENRQKFADAIDWDRLETWRGMGGVRLEDNVLVTGGDPVVLTAAIPLGN